MHLPNIGSKNVPQQFEAQKIQYPDELPEVEGRTGHEQVHGITDPSFEVISQHPVIALEMADDWLDGGPAAKAFSGFALLMFSFWPFA